MQVLSRLAFFSFLFLLACQKPAPSSENQKPGEKSGDFETFYDRFHTDEAYQLAHIPFPIKGAPDNAANKPGYDENFTWTKENWVINKPIDLKGTQFKRELQSVSDELVVERLIHESGSYGMVRRFAKIDGEWMLIYYQGVNPQ